MLALVASVALVAYSAVYYIIQVSPRYRFPLEPMLFLLSAQLLTVEVRFGQGPASILIRERVGGPLLAYFPATAIRVIRAAILGLRRLL